MGRSDILFLAKGWGVTNLPRPKGGDYPSLYSGEELEIVINNNTLQKEFFRYIFNLETLEG